MKRRDFLDRLALGGAGLSVLWASACGDDDGGGGGSDAGACNAQPEILDNHGHTLDVPDADVRSGAGATYMVSGGTHTHSVTITATLFRQLQSTGSVMVGTEGGVDHEHAIRVTCA